MHNSISSLSYLLVSIAGASATRRSLRGAAEKVRLIPPRADPPGSGFSNTNFSLLPCPENPGNTANGSGKILESDSAQLRRFERVTIVVSGPYTNVGSNHPPSRVPSPGIPDTDRSPPP